MNIPQTQLFRYYKGTTFRWAETFVDIVDGTPEPANLQKPSGQTFLAHIRPVAQANNVWATLPNSVFTLGYSDTNEPNIFDELSIEASAELFESIPEGSWAMDIFMYYESGGVEQRDCILVIELEVIENVTKKDFN